MFDGLINKKNVLRAIKVVDFTSTKGRTANMVNSTFVQLLCKILDSVFYDWEYFASSIT